METHQTQPLTSNILPAASTENESLVTIFPFDLDKITPVLLFSGAALNTKLITTMYTDTKVDNQPIKLILNSCQVDHTVSIRIITADEATKTSISEIDDFPFEINGITILIKVLVIEATQYQTLIDNDWLQNGQHTQVSAMCRHFKLITTPSAPLIKFEEEKKNLPKKPIKYPKLMKITTSYHQYFLEMTREK
ncbi:hypothetical protein G9A89_010382 [Geosiphon pyriformis]|nr:hypothetical protein G9A89_010382 [Geosiphon pyriformis]